MGDYAMLSLVPDSVATARRDADDVRIAQDVCDGRLSSIELDYSRRGRDRHCLVALPPLPAEVADIRSPIWLRMSAQYEAADDGTMDPRRPFTLFVTWFAGGVAISEERHRFHAGAAEAALCLRLEGDPEADCYQVTFYSDRSYGGALTIGDPHIVADGHVFRFAAGRHAVTRIDRRKRWSQRGRRVSCRAFFGEHFADMPVGWSLDEVHPAALAMAEWFLYAKIEAAFFGEDVAAPVLPAVGGRPAGDRTLLSFSLGTDSTAAAALLPPDTQAYYCKRAYEAYLLPSGAEVSLPPHRIYAAGLARMPSLVIVPNTFEAIGL
ncbi:MAG: hypothetical protein ACRDVZ_08470, partial [Jiangellaceae bacterium]